MTVTAQSLTVGSVDKVVPAQRSAVPSIKAFWDLVKAKTHTGARAAGHFCQ
jgi:hypothetical protein